MFPIQIRGLACAVPHSNRGEDENLLVLVFYSAGAFKVSQRDALAILPRPSYSPLRPCRQLTIQSRVGKAQTPGSNWFS